jgi:hypothetical protein
MASNFKSTKLRKQLFKYQTYLSTISIRCFNEQDGAGSIGT